MRPGISEVTIGTFPGPMSYRFGVTGAAGVIQGMVVTCAPTGGVLMAGFTTPRIMPNWGKMATTAGCCGVLMDINRWCPGIGIMAILTHTRIMVAWGAMAIRTHGHPSMIHGYL